MVNGSRFFVYLGFVSLVFMVIFVMAAPAAPINLIFEQNTTSQYDKEGIFSVNWTSGGGDEVNYSIYVSTDGGTSWYLKADNDSNTGYSFSNTTDANYTFRVEAVNATLDAVNSSSDISMVVDTTVPLIDYATGVEVDNVNLSQSNIFINVSVTETNEKNINFLLYNSTGLVNSTTYTDGTRTINFTGLSDEVYTYNVTIVDNAENSNTTSTRTITLDITNPLIDYATGVEADNANVSKSNIFVNVSVTETNEKNITFLLYNSTGLVNSTTYTDGTRIINFTGLSDEVYTYNVTVNDDVENSNTTSTRTITLDTTDPLIDYATGVEVDNANVSQFNVFVNVSVAEINEKNITFLLYNSTGLVNSTTYTDGTRIINFTGLSDEVYTYNVTVNDDAGNSNTTATRTIALDTANSLIDVTYPTNTNYVVAPVIFNYTYTEANCGNVWYSNDSGATNYSVQSCGANFTSMITVEGSNTWVVYINDSSGNENSSSVSFVVDTTNPVASASCLPSSVTVGESVSCTCSGIDGGSGINSSLTTAGSTPSTSSVGTFNYTCSVTDNVGNSNNDTASYSVTAASSSSGGSSSYLTYRPSVSKLSAGYDISLGVNSRVNFDIGGEGHTLKVDSISGDKVKITISSDPISLELVVGGSEKVDVDHDGYYDLSVYLKEIRSSRADFVLTSISENVGEDVASVAEEGAVVEEEVLAAEEGVEVLKEKNWLWLWVVLILVIVAAIAWKKGLLGKA